MRLGGRVGLDGAPVKLDRLLVVLGLLRFVSTLEETHSP
jgi:hypothetical protein